MRGAYFNAGSKDIGPDPNYKPVRESYHTRGKMPKPHQWRRHCAWLACRRRTQWHSACSKGCSPVAQLLPHPCARACAPQTPADTARRPPPATCSCAGRWDVEDK